MNKTAIKNYAVWARNELIKQVKQRAYRYGITADGGSDTTAPMSDAEKLAKERFEDEIKKNGFERAVEEVAYTWFNRFVALRYMEVNGYIPGHMRVFTDYKGAFHPEILTDASRLDEHLCIPEGGVTLDMQKIAYLINDSKEEELYRYLLLSECNALHSQLPEMFEEMGAYTELLLPTNILKPDSVIGRLVTDIPEEDFKDGVQIIGWLYQYYNTEPKQAVFDGLKKNVKITRENIPAATQLFTPDWIVRYMVENSLGRVLIQTEIDAELIQNSEFRIQNDGSFSPDVRKALINKGIGDTDAQKIRQYQRERIAKEKELAERFGWKYYIPEAEQAPEVFLRASELRERNPVKSIEYIRVLDPCMGSSHILLYSFDVLMQMYEYKGYSRRDAAKLILEKNLHGLDIDRRAYQLAYFALMMKAREYSRQILTQGVQPQVYEPTGYYDGMEYGSLVKIDKLDPRPEPPDKPNEIYAQALKAWNFRRLLSQKYDAVITNPPYMGNKGLNGKVSEFLQKNYPDFKSDTFSAFIVHCGEMTKPGGYVGMFTPYVWMFIQSYENLRNHLYNTKNISTLVQFEYSAFEEATVPVCTFVYENCKTGKTGNYFRLVDFRGGMEVQRQKYLEALKNPDCGFFYTASADNFSKIPGSPVAYWVSKNILNAFEIGIPLKNIGEPRSGMSTTDNNKFLRQWYEVSFNNIGLNFITRQEAQKSGNKWFPYNKGGDFRKWYGNNDYVVNWKNDGFDIKEAAKGATGGRIVNSEYFFKESITWSKISSGNIAFRYKPIGYIFDVAGTSIFLNANNMEYMLGFCNSNLALKIANILSPTLNYEAGHISSYPIIKNEEKQNQIDSLVTQNIALSRADWDAFETSWDFRMHPLVELAYANGNSLAAAPPLTSDLSPLTVGTPQSSAELAYTNGNSLAAASPLTSDLSPLLLKDVYSRWQSVCQSRFDTLKENEEELNRLFIDIYGLRDELTPEVDDKDVTVRKADLTRDVKSLISYAVGCMFGRYSPLKPGLMFAGGEWDIKKFQALIPGMPLKDIPAEQTVSEHPLLPDPDNVIPICDDDYFDDDITNMFVNWIAAVYGDNTLHENLRFIAEALGGTGDPRDVIRKYFLNDFYKDHVRTYKKRPIYWLFDSGKKHGFKALIYMHRYRRDTVARVRTDYLHEQQERYATQLRHIEILLKDAQGSERAKLLKRQTKLAAQAAEAAAYEEKIHHLADMNMQIDLDDGVKHNYALFGEALSKI